MIRVRSTLLIVVAVFVMMGVLHSTEVVLVDERADGVTQVGAGLLIEAKVDASVDPCVADIVRDLLEPRVLKSDPRHGGVRHRDGMMAGTVGAPQNLGGAVARAPVIRRIAGKTRRQYV